MGRLTTNRPEFQKNNKSEGDRSLAAWVGPN